MQQYFDEKWKLDKRVPLALIIALCLQLSGALVWATQLDARVNLIESQSMHNASFHERFARIEERLENVKQDTRSMKQLLAKLTERRFK